MHDLLARLNPEQRRAATTIDGPVLIIAGAGSGKTSVITHRIAYMLSEGVAPDAILALTFTNKAAAEMRHRIRDLLQRAAFPAPARIAGKLTIGTFHAFGLSVLKRYAAAAGLRPRFSVYDQADQTGLLKESARELDIDPAELDVWNVLAAFSGIKTGRLRWGDPLLQELKPERGDLRTLYDSYQDHLRVYNCVDFDDLIVKPIALFDQDAKVLHAYHDRYSHFLVDEFQDTSTLQYRLLERLAGAQRNLCVVGDDDQSIYSWRGADFRNIESFERDFAERREIKLERNYRSTGPILEAANSLIANNVARKPKALWTPEASGNPIEVVYPNTEEDEAAFIVGTLKRVAYEQGSSYDTFGILVRTNGQTRAIEEALLEADVPYRVSGGTSFFQRKEIKDITAYLRVVFNPDDGVNLLRVINTPRRGIGIKSVEALQALAEREHCSLFSAATLLVHGQADAGVGTKARNGLADLVELIERYSGTFDNPRELAQTTEALVEEVGYWPHLIHEHPANERTAKAKWKNIGYLIRSIQRYQNNPDVADPSLEGYLNRISLQARDALSDDEIEGQASLMTVHAAKGLEWDVVFVAGVEEGVMPHQRAVEENGLEEERRLFYVALTRARTRLILSSCAQRSVGGEVVTAQPSRFLAELPEEHVLQRPADAESGAELPSDPFALIRAKMGE